MCASPTNITPPRKFYITNKLPLPREDCHSITIPRTFVNGVSPYPNGIRHGFSNAIHHRVSLLVSETLYSNGCSHAIFANQGQHNGNEFGRVLAALLIAATNALRTRVSEPQQLLNRQVTFSNPTAPSAGEEPDPPRPAEKSRLHRFDSRKSAFTMWNDDTGYGEARKESLRRAVPNNQERRMEIVPLWEHRQHVGQCACCTGTKDAQ
ncbi:Protein of unknown function [Gryllus bimaculatus]|nr:Protein of unknown function [Gryllus bimaculatus]